MQPDLEALSMGMAPMGSMGGFPAMPPMNGAAAPFADSGAQRCDFMSMAGGAQSAFGRNGAAFDSYSSPPMAMTPETRCSDFQAPAMVMAPPPGPPPAGPQPSCWNDAGPWEQRREVVGQTGPSTFAMGGMAPSKGSALHDGTGKCSPCAWFWKAKGCSTGAACTYCHLCPNGELKRRKKAKIGALRRAEAEAKAAIRGA